jgi:hypothetical protein
MIDAVSETVDGYRSAHHIRPVSSCDALMPKTDTQNRLLGPGKDIRRYAEILASTRMTGPRREDDAIHGKRRERFEGQCVVLDDMRLNAGNAVNSDRTN